MIRLFGYGVPAFAFYAVLHFGLGLSAHAIVLVLEFGAPALLIGLLVLVAGVSGSNYVAPMPARRPRTPEPTRKPARKPARRQTQAAARTRRSAA